MLPQRADSILPVTIRHILITGRRIAAGFGPAAALLSEPCVPPPIFLRGLCATGHGSRTHGSRDGSDSQANAAVEVIVRTPEAERAEPLEVLAANGTSGEAGEPQTMPVSGPPPSTTRRWPVT